MLHSEKPILDIRVSNPFWKHDCRFARGMGVCGIPTRYVPGGLHRPGMLLRGRRSREAGSSASHGSVHDVADISTQIVGSFVQGIVGHIPTRLGESLVEGPLVRKPKTAAQGSSAVTEHVPGKTNSWPKI